MCIDQENEYWRFGGKVMTLRDWICEFEDNGKDPKVMFEFLGAADEDDYKDYLSCLFK